MLCALILNPIARRRRQRLAAMEEPTGAATPESNADTVVSEGITTPVTMEKMDQKEVVDVEKGQCEA